jgi:3-oxoadipate enol-lactonase
MRTLGFDLRGPGDAPVLVLSSSLGTTRELWRPQRRVLERHVRVLVYDHPGHGDSALPEVPTTVEALARPLHALLDELELGRVSICGLSLGGMVAVALALDAPERVERLVLACTSAHLPPPDAWLERARVVRAAGMEAVADAVLERWFTPTFARENPHEVARARALLVSTSPEGYARACEAIAAWDVRDRLHELTPPTLVVAGADDPATPPAHAELLAERIPGARLHVLERAAHLANVERADSFTHAVLEHLEVGIPT